MIEQGAWVVLYLGSPREQIFGSVLTLNASGVSLRGITLSSVDDWLREVAGFSSGSSSSFGLTTTFYPMHRIEKITLDEAAHGAPSLQERFHERTKLTLPEYLEREDSRRGLPPDEDVAEV